MRWSCLLLLAACGVEGREGGAPQWPSDSNEGDGEGGGAPESTSPPPYQCGIRGPHGSTCACDDGRSGTVLCADCCWCSCHEEAASLCGTGLSFDERGPIDQCVETMCCDAFVACVDPDGANADACATCLDAGGGPICNDLVACLEDSACQGDPGLCGTGIRTGEPDVDACIDPGCCDAFAACTDDFADVDGCLACLDAGGGPRCDAFLGCWNECAEGGAGGGDGGTGGAGGAGGAGDAGGAGGGGGR